MGGIRAALLWAATCFLMPAAAFGQTMVEGKHFDFSPAEYHAAAPQPQGPEKAKGLVRLFGPTQALVYSGLLL